MTSRTLNFYTYPTAHGPITLGATERGICAVSFSDAPLDGNRRATELTNAAATQLQEYLAGKRREFDVPLDVAGSAFQRNVWLEVSAIPYGHTATAAAIAQAIGKPGSHRSVGTAIRRNPAPVLIPTHRIELPNSTGQLAKLYSALRSLEARNRA